jgi:hypothetical protein
LRPEPFPGRCPAAPAGITLDPALPGKVEFNSFQAIYDSGFNFGESRWPQGNGKSQLS